MTEDPIMAALMRLEDGQQAMENRLMERINANHEQTLARFDQLQTRLDNLDAMQTVGFGDVDRVEKTNEFTVKQLTALRDVIRVMEKRITTIEGKLAS